MRHILKGFSAAGFSIVILFTIVSHAMATTPTPMPDTPAVNGIVSGLKAFYRDGQVFLTWQEADSEPGTTFNIYHHHSPILKHNINRSTKLAGRIEAHSGRDWWHDPASFSKSGENGIPIGFLITTDDKRLNPQNGLFVHTVTSKTAGDAFFAITVTNPYGIESKVLRMEENSLTNPIYCSVAPPQPIWQERGKKPLKNAGNGKPLIVNLHWRGGGATAGKNAQKPGNYLFFGDGRQGWREGLAFKFLLRIKRNGVYIEPYDRAWTGGRAIFESADERDHCPAVNTWWYGYHPDINETTDRKTTVIPNYTEEVVLGMIRWAHAYLGTDTSRTYLVGTSMGGSGAIFMALHHPDIFAAAISIQGVVAYTKSGAGTIKYIESVSGNISNTTMAPNGNRLLDHMNGNWLVQSNTSNLPYLFCANSKRDTSIPWENNPPFFRVLNDSRQGLTAYWNNERHVIGRKMKSIVAGWKKRMLRYRLNKSYPVFTNCSLNQEAGTGSEDSGHTEGWINKGLDWRDVVDTRDKYALTIFHHFQIINRKPTVDITIRRLQEFIIRPGDLVRIKVGGIQSYDTVVDTRGLVTIKRVCVDKRRGVRIELTN